MTLRRIAPIPALAGKVERNDPGKKPELIWVHPRNIYVDESYQRNISRAGGVLIAKIVKGFLWRRMKPPICVHAFDDDGKPVFHCIDGQHTAIAAITRGIEAIPIFVVDAPTTEERADSFVRHNQDRVYMNRLELFRGQLRAGDPLALDVQKALDMAGCRFRANLHHPKIRVHPGDNFAISAVTGMVQRHGVARAARVMEALRLGGETFRPVEVQVAEHVMLKMHPHMPAATFARVVRALGQTGLIQLQAESRITRVPVKNLLLKKYIALIDSLKLNVSAA